MRTFLCKAIDVPDLQTHTKELVSDMNVFWMNIFNRIQLNYRFIESTEALRSGGEFFVNQQTRRALESKNTP